MSKGYGIIVSLCDLTGNMVKPWAFAGYDCYCVDIQHSIRRDKVDAYCSGGSITYVWGDVRSWTPPQRVAMGFAFTPCTNVAVSGARDFAKKGYPMLRDALDMFHSAVSFFGWAGCPWMAENPVGRIAGIMGKAEHTFDPCDYAGYSGGEEDRYTKKTCLWTGGGFRMPIKRRVEPDQGSKMHLMPPSEDRANKRSATPMGFAQAVFEANRHLVTAGNYLPTPVASDLKG